MSVGGMQGLHIWIMENGLPENQTFIQHHSRADLDLALACRGVQGHSGPGFDNLKHALETSL